MRPAIFMVVPQAAAAILRKSDKYGIGLLSMYSCGGRTNEGLKKIQYR